MSIVGTPVNISSGGNYTAETGSDRIAVFLINTEPSADGSINLTGGTFGSAALEIAVQAEAAGGQVAAIAFVREANIPVGANAVTLTYDSTPLTGGVIRCYTLGGRDQTSPVDVTDTNISIATQPYADTLTGVSSDADVFASITGATPSRTVASVTGDFTLNNAVNSGTYSSSRLVIDGWAGGDASFSATWATGSNAGAAALASFSISATLPPSLSLGTPTGTSGPAPSVGFTSTSAVGTARIVIDSAANLDTVTAAQVLAGQKDNGTAAAYDSGDITVSDTTPEYAFSGLATGTYTVAAAQDNGSESDVLTWTLTIDATAPSFTSGPTITSPAATSAMVGVTSSEGAASYVVVTASGASQPSNATFDSSSFTEEVVADTPFTTPVTGLTPLSLLRAWVQLVDQYDNRATDSEYVLTSPTGYSRVTIGTPNPTASERLTGTADIATGDVVAWGNIVGTGSVVVYDTASWEADAGVTSFTFYIGNHTDGWGSSAVQDVEGLDELAPNLTSATIQANAVSLILAFDEAVEFGAGGNGGVTVSMSGGAATATYASGSGTSSLTYTLSRSIATAETGTVSYTQPTNGIEDASGNDLASLGPTVLTNNSTNDGLAPLFTNGIVAADGDSITFQASKAVVIGAGGNGGLTVSMNGGACTLTYSSGSGTANLVYTTSRTIAGYESGTASYTQPGNGIEDAFGNDTASFSGLPITNNSEVNTAPTAITISRNRVSLTGGVNAVVGTLGNNDPDTGDTFTYTLVAGTGDTDNASFSISGAVLRCDDPSVLGLGVYSVRVNVNDGTADYAQPLSITVYEAGLVELIKDIVRGICRDIVRDVT